MVCVPLAFEKPYIFCGLNTAYKLLSKDSELLKNKLTEDLCGNI